MCYLYTLPNSHYENYQNKKKQINLIAADLKYDVVHSIVQSIYCSLYCS